MEPPANTQEVSAWVSAKEKRRGRGGEEKGVERRGVRPKTTFNSSDTPTRLLEPL